MNELPIVLLAEDDPAIVRMIERLINRTLGNAEKNPKFKYLEFSNGSEAIAAIQGDTQKLIIAVITDNTLLDGFKGLQVVDAAVQAEISYVTSLSSYDASGLIEKCKDTNIASRSVAKNNSSTIAIGFEGDPTKDKREVTCNLKPATSEIIIAIAQEIKPHLEAYYFKGLEHS